MTSLQAVNIDLDFILSHFKAPIWPRRISTKTTQNYTLPVYSREEALARFKQANYLDCKISAYPSYVEWKGINRQAPDLIFIDKDLSRFKSMEALSRALKNTLKNIKNRLDDAYPSILWSGNGYHILQPIEAFILESEDVFNKFENPSIKFLRFAEPYLSNNKADPCHSNSLSFKNCMLRIPGSHNSKCVLKNNGITDSTTEVKIIQRWDGKRPAINWLLRDFRRHLIQEKIDIMKDTRFNRIRSSHYPTNTNNNHSAKWPWVEVLLKIQLDDHRKYALWRIIAPYLINIKTLSYQDAFNVMKDWLNKCDSIRKLDFNARAKTKEAINSVENYRPVSFKNLKEEYREVYDIIYNCTLRPPYHHLY